MIITKKIVNGYKIKKHENSRNCFISVEEDGVPSWDWQFFSFRSIKEATEFANHLPAKCWQGRKGE